SNKTTDGPILWKILEEAAQDDYLPVIKSLFDTDRGKSRWPLTRLKNISYENFDRFVNRIQFKVLDHPTSLKARSEAWTNIDHGHCDTNN
ncbi:unnamed protein product, partial [Didymodactylos carnosus]